MAVRSTKSCTCWVSVFALACSQGESPGQNSGDPSGGDISGDTQAGASLTSESSESTIGLDESTSTGSDPSTDGDAAVTTDSEGDDDSPATTSGSTGDEHSVCGNGIVEGDEPCDTSELGGKQCQDEGFGGGDLACNPDCTLDTSNCSRCGNNVKDDDAEQCDGQDLGDTVTCEDAGLGSASEPVSCTENCTHDYSACSGCGDGNLMDPETCEPGLMPGDPPNLAGLMCVDLGFDGGTLACTDGCAFDKTGCFGCGNGSKEAIEECDSDDLGGLSCLDFLSQAGPNFTGGSLLCTDTCALTTDNCKYCGDALITADEACDGSNLAGASCTTRGHDGGTLACSGTCVFDESACTDCGDGQSEGDEQCDGDDLASASCTSLGFVNGGTLTCSSSCTYVTSQCLGATCGDAVVNAPETCDCGPMGSGCTSAELGNKACTDLAAPSGGNYTGGVLSCFSPSNCNHDKSDCWYCGNNEKEGTESCDGSDLAGKTCANIGGFTSGTLSCNASCGFNTSGCTNLTTLTSILNTDNFPGLPTSMLRHMSEGLPGRIAIMVPSDVATLSLKLSPNNGTDKLDVQLKDGSTFAMCTASANGGLCDLGSSIPMSGHNGKVVVAEVTETNGSADIGALTITVSAATAGLASSMSTSSTWRSVSDLFSTKFPADYVIWPVGPATDATFSYVWSTTAMGDNQAYYAGIISPAGTQNSPQQFSQGAMPPPPDVSTWPRTNTPSGWYLFGTSTNKLWAAGKSWTLTVQP